MRRASESLLADMREALLAVHIPSDFSRKVLAGHKVDCGLSTDRGVHLG